MSTGCVHVMTCTVCNTDYKDLTGWNQHLILTEHQHKTKLSFSKWDEEARKCAFVIYASFPMVNISTLLSVVNNFSTGTTIVTDLVRSDNKPRVLILQLESREKVTQVLTVGRSQQIENQLIQLRRLDEFLELEWNELTSYFVGEHVPFDRIPVNEIVASERYHGHDPKVFLNNGKRGTTKNKERRRLGCERREWSLESEINSIMSKLEIPDSEFKTAMETLEELTQLLRKQTKLEVNVSLYRNNYLKMRNNNHSNNYLAFVYYFVGDQYGFGTLKSFPDHLKDLKSQNGETCSHLHRITVLDPNEKVNSCELGNQVLHNELTTTKIKITAYPWAMVEVQLSRLVAFYCRCDVRITHLLGILYYWKDANKISLATYPIYRWFAHRMAPDPVALEWLLLFFLYHQEKIIPTPMEVLSRPHKPIIVGLPTTNNKPDSGQVDLGFDDDPHFINEWKQNEQRSKIPTSPDKLSMSTLKLFQNFLTFCCDKMGNSCVLNTYNGLLIHSGSPPSTCAAYGNLIHNQEIMQFVIEHPMYRLWKFKVDSKKWFITVIPVMQQSARQIGELVRRLESNPEELNLNQGVHSQSLMEVLQVRK